MINIEGMVARSSYKGPYTVEMRPAGKASRHQR